MPSQPMGMESIKIEGLSSSENKGKQLLISVSMIHPGKVFVRVRGRHTAAIQKSLEVGEHIEYDAAEDGVFEITLFTLEEYSDAPSDSVFQIVQTSTRGNVAKSQNAVKVTLRDRSEIIGEVKSMTLSLKGETIDPKQIRTIQMVPVEGYGEPPSSIWLYSGTALAFRKHDDMTGELEMTYGNGDKTKKITLGDLWRFEHISDSQDKR